MLFTGTGASTYDPLDEDNLQVSFSVVADSHIESNNTSRYRMFADALSDMAGASYKNDATVICGDVTMNGQFIEYLALASVLAFHGRSKNTLLAMGNHEIFTAANGYDRGSKKFIAFSRLVSGNKTGKPYYYDIINGYYFIILGSEKDMGVQAYISPNQLQWLDGTLEQATQGGMPAFVFCHFPLSGTVRTLWSDGLIGEQSDEMKAILEKYDNICYFSGHLHNSIDYSGVTELNGVHYIDLPCMTGDSNCPGYGYQVEVYGDRVELRPRSYAKQGAWLEDYGVTVSLTDTN